MEKIVKLRQERMKNISYMKYISTLIVNYFMHEINYINKQNFTFPIPARNYIYLHFPRPRQNTQKNPYNFV